MTATNGSSLERWERRTGWPLTAAALAFLVAYAWPILQPDMPAGRAQTFGRFGIGVWAVFVLDYATRVVLADDRRLFVRRHLFDVVVIALPMLRRLRALRVRGISMRYPTRAMVAGLICLSTTLAVSPAATAAQDAPASAYRSTVTIVGGDAAAQIIAPQPPGCDALRHQSGVVGSDTNGQLRVAWNYNAAKDINQITWSWRLAPTLVALATSPANVTVVGNLNGVPQAAWTYSKVGFPTDYNYHSGFYTPLPRLGNVYDMTVHTTFKVPGGTAHVIATTCFFLAS